MSVRAQSADGVIHEFPDGTDMAVVDRVMKDYATKASGNQPQGWGPYGAPQPAEPDDPYYLKSLDNTVRAVANGATLGGMDELAAAGRAIGPAASALIDSGGSLSATGHAFSQAYDRNLSQERARDAEFHRTNPNVAIAAEIVGGLGTALAAAPYTVVRGLGAGGNMALNTAIGAGAGAASGFLSGEGGAGNRLANAAVPAAIGGALGLAAGPLAWAAGKTVAPAARRVLDWVGRDVSTGAEREAATRIARGLSRNDMTAGEAASRLQGLGPEGMLADVSPATQGLAETIAQKPTGGAAKLIDALRHRQEEAGHRLSEAAQTALGGQGDFWGGMKALDAQRRAAAKPLYDAAYAQEIPLTDELRDILSRPSVQNAWARAQRLAAEEGRNIRPIFVKAADGSVRLNDQAIPDMQSWDYIKRGLDDVVGDFKDPITGRIKGEEGYAVNGTRQELLDALKNANPTYGKALAAWAGPSQAMDMMTLGRQFMRNDAEITADRIAKMSAADKEAFREGVLREIQDTLHRAPDGADAAKRILGSALKRQKIRAAFGDPGAYARFMEAAEREITFYRTYSQATGNSATVRRLNGEADLMGNNPLAAGLRGAAALARPTDTLRTWAAGLDNPGEAVIDALANALMSKDSRSVIGILGRVSASQRREVYRQATERLLSIEGGASRRGPAK